MYMCIDKTRQQVARLNRLFCYLFYPRNNPPLYNYSRRINTALVNIHQPACKRCHLLFDIFVKKNAMNGLMYKKIASSDLVKGIKIGIEKNSNSPISI